MDSMLAVCGGHIVLATSVKSVVHYSVTDAEITMASNRSEQHIQMIIFFYQNECLLVQKMGELCSLYGRCGDPSRLTLQREVAKFETTDTVNNKPTHVCQKRARSAQTSPVHQSVQENPRQSILCDGLELD